MADDNGTDQAPLPDPAPAPSQPMAGADVHAAFADQIAYCRANDASVTGRIVTALGALLDDAGAGPFIARLRDWPGHALAEGVPLRAAGALHGLHIARAEPALDAVYEGRPADDGALVRAAVRTHADRLMPWLDGPPQTNEAGRSAGFVAAMLWLANQGLPARFECLEIGSSAGINLMLDRYRYDLAGRTVGPDAPVMTLKPEWRGAPPPAREIAIAPARGCDVAPLDLTDPADALRLQSYIWPEHTVRFERLAAAVAAARVRPPDLARMHAADFVEQALARLQSEGTTRVLMHSIVWQYLPESEQQRITRAMEAAGATAGEERALAWIALEADRSLMGHRLRVRCWPYGDQRGGDEMQLATAHAHGAWIAWDPLS